MQAFGHNIFFRNQTTQYDFTRPLYYQPNIKHRIKQKKMKKTEFEIAVGKYRVNIKETNFETDAKLHVATKDQKVALKRLINRKSGFLPEAIRLRYD